MAAQTLGKHIVGSNSPNKSTLHDDLLIPPVGKYERVALMLKSQTANSIRTTPGRTTASVLCLAYANSSQSTGKITSPDALTDRRASHKQASISRAGSSNQNVERHPPVSQGRGNIEELSPIARWQAFQASFQPFQGISRSRRASDTYESSHLQEFLGNANGYVKQPGAVHLIKACTAAAKDGDGHEVVDILRRRREELQNEQDVPLVLMLDFIKVSRTSAKPSSGCRVPFVAECIQHH